MNNDENMLIARGDTALATAYGVHFMRLWQHFDYRHRLARGVRHQDGGVLVSDVPREPRGVGVVTTLCGVCCGPGCGAKVSVM